MVLNRRAWPLFLVALLLAVLGFVPQNAEAQLSGTEFKGNTGFDSGLQEPPRAQRDILLTRFRITETNGRLADQSNLEPSLDFVVPSFRQNNSAGFEGSLFQAVNFGEHAGESAALPLPSSPNPSDQNQGWHFSVSPYLWLPALHGTIGARGHDASVHASFSDIFSNFSFALMGAFDPRYNRIVMPLDFMWIRLTNDNASPFDVLASSANIKVNLDVLTQKIGYRVVDAEKFKVDALAGFRYWHAGTTVNLESSILPATRFYSSADWVDGVGGARIQIPLSPKLILTIAGDAGGGGANSDYQVGGLIGWKLKKFVLQAGYRYLTVNYRPGNTVLDVTISGLILGATIPLK